MLSDQLPIYNVTFELTKLLYTYVKNFNRIDRIIIGEKMVNTSMNMLHCILNANSNETIERIKHLNKLKTLIETEKTLFRFCIEKKIFSYRQSSVVTMKLASIGKQLTGWRKSTIDKIDNIKNSKKEKSDDIYYKDMQASLDELAMKNNS